MTRPRSQSKRKLLIVGKASRFERALQAQLRDCAVFLAESLKDARFMLEAHPELTLALVEPGCDVAWLRGLLADRPQLQVLLLTADHALGRELAAVPAAVGGLGPLRGILADELAPDELAAAIQAAFEHIERAEAGQAGTPRADEVRDALTPWLHISAGDRVQLSKDWLSVIAHDLRTPLGISNSYAALLLDPDFALLPEARDIVQRIRANGEWMLELVDGILDFAAQGGRRPALRIEPATLGSIVAAVTERMQGLAGPRQVRLEVTVPKAATRYLVDRTRVEQVLHNLVDNAVKVSDPGGTVQICAGAIRDQLTFQVRDAGPGLNHDDAARTFAKFPSGATGRGLGLAICKAIVELHGGHIWVESSPGQGSTFGFTIAPAKKNGARTRATSPRPAATRSRK